MVTSRGCVFSCVYCGSAKIKKWRARSPEDVVKEMKLLYDRFDIKGFYFGDDIFSDENIAFIVIRSGNIWITNKRRKKWLKN